MSFLRGNSADLSWKDGSGDLLKNCNKNLGGGGRCSKLSDRCSRSSQLSVSSSYFLMEVVTIKSRSMPKWAIIGAVNERESLSTMKIVNKSPANISLASNWDY